MMIKRIKFIEQELIEQYFTGQKLRKTKSHCIKTSCSDGSAHIQGCVHVCVFECAIGLCVCV